MKNKWLLIGLSSLFLAGCGSKNDANEHNFTVAIKQYLSDNGDLCLNVGPFPVDVTQAELHDQAAHPAGIAAQMVALQRAGLLTSVDVSLSQLEFVDDRPTGHRMQVRRFDLTTNGRDAYRQFLADTATATGKPEPSRGDLCYGKLGLDKVSGWDGPTQVAGHQEATVRYSYTVDSVAAWAKAAPMEAAFPAINNVSVGASQQALATTLVLGDKGWSARRH